MKISITAILALGVAIQACSPSRQTNNSIVVPSGTTIDNIEQPVVIGTKKQMAYPKAVIYKTNGNFSNNVPITLSADSKKLISFPAPSDITEQTAPIKLSQGYWLDRRGISPNTAFTKFTYRQYAQLKSTPSASELKKAIIPGAIVTEIVQLPYPVGQVSVQQCDSLISNNLTGCNILLKRESIMIGPENL
ncbi:hypothetical protein [uncultured Muribaculum sp.]|uniref:hypothetical protein n=1 Tax=uncultured Muribaculum sp. TaxID=1918613 RepID=UPI0026751F4A|nr:hypothetical protein [uncultured Muribaculum sp.]